MGSKRRSDTLETVRNNELPKEMVLTMGLLIGGTPVILYGEEIGLDQVNERKKRFLNIKRFYFR